MAATELRKDLRDRQPRHIAATGPEVPVRQRRLNTRLLVGTVLVISVAGTAGYFWHSYQVQRTADAFLQRATQLANEQDWRAAYQNVNRYLHLEPNDSAAREQRIRAAQFHDKAFSDPRGKLRSVELYYAALGVVQEDKLESQLRGRLCELLLELQRYRTAESEALQQLKKNPQDAPALRCLALALCGQIRAGKLTGLSSEGRSVGQSLADAVAANPEDTELAVRLAEIYRDFPDLLSVRQRVVAATVRDRDEAADKILDSHVAGHPDSSAAWLARHEYRVRYKLEGAEEDLQKALKLAPDDSNVVFAAAQFRRHQGGTGRNQAVAHLERLLDQIDPKNEPAILALGEIYLAEGQTDKAISVWKMGLEKIGKGAISLNAQLATVYITQGKVEQAELCLDAFDRGFRSRGLRIPDSVRKSVAQSRNLLRARWLIKKAEVERNNIFLLKAIPLLQRFTGSGGNPSEHVREILNAWLLLAQANVSLNQWDSAASAYEHASKLEPRSAAYRRLAADCWFSAGRPSLAARGYEDALSIEDEAESWHSLALARLREQSVLPVEERNWKFFEVPFARVEAMAEAGRLAQPWRAGLLKADYLMARAEEEFQPDKALAVVEPLLRKTEAQAPESPELLQRLLVGYETLGAHEDADRIAAKLEALTDGEHETPLARVQLHMLRKQYAEARRLVEERLNSLSSSEDREKLEALLVRIRMAQGEVAEVRRDLAPANIDGTDDLQQILTMADLALQERDFETAQEWEIKLRNLEGDDGFVWRYLRAMRLVTSASDRADPGLSQAKEDQEAVELARPSWPSTHVLKGMLREKSGDEPGAIAAYEEAIRYGESRTVVFHRLIYLLRNDAAKAQKYLSMMRDPGAVASGLADLEIYIAARAGKMERALMLARREVKRRPNDAAAHFWLARMLTNNAPRDAEATSELLQAARDAYARAVDLDPQSAQNWSGLFLFFLRTDQAEMANQTIELMEKKATLTPVRKADLMAQFYALLQQRDKAEAKLKEALQLDDTDVDIHVRLAGLCLESDPVSAEKHLRTVLKLVPSHDHARRMLASILASRGGSQEWQEAVALLDADKDKDPSYYDARLQAMVLAQRRGAENLAKAREILEELITDVEAATPGDRLLLARIYEIEGSQAAAQRQYMALVARQAPNAQQLAAYVEYLFRQNKWDAAEHWLSRLGQVAPIDLGTAALKARWLHRMKREEEVEPYLEELAAKIEPTLDTIPQREQLYFRMGQIYASVENFVASERWNRRLFELAPKSFGSLARSLARQGRKTEAIQLCLAASSSDASARPAATLCMVLLTGPNSAADWDLAKPLLVRARSEHEDNAQLLMSLANAYYLQQEQGQAIELYRRVIRMVPKSPMALNNLAALLAEQPDQAEAALEYIDRAIEFKGHHPSLLDTKAVILIHHGTPQQAIPLLKTAVASTEPDPRYGFHLALAYYRTKELAKSREQLQKAIEDGLSQYVLSPLEQELLAEMNAALL